VPEKIPLVTVGMPVRNGGALFREALQSVVSQDYQNLEIIVSDNASTDETAEITREFQARDSRIVYIRQPTMLGIFDNFTFVLNKARGEYFMWAAHDDTRSVNFVSALLEAFVEPSVALAFGDLDIRPGLGAESFRRTFVFDNASLAPVWRIKKQAFMQCYHCYGLWRMDRIRSINWAFAPWWTDLPLMITAAGLGTFRYVPGATFSYLEILKSDAERANAHEKLAASPKLINVMRLLRATWLTAWRSLPLHLALAGFLFVLLRELRDIAGWSERRIRRMNFLRQVTR
jgi:glycosyltransferase involved in cell wall biosynthesis